MKIRPPAPTLQMTCDVELRMDRRFWEEYGWRGDCRGAGVEDLDGWIVAEDKLKMPLCNLKCPCTSKWIMKIVVEHGATSSHLARF